MASLWVELKRRNVVRVAILYVVASWLVLQAADVLFQNLGAPDWAFGFVLGILVLFFVPVLVFAWAFELTPEGLKRDSGIDRVRSAGYDTGRRLNLVTIVLVIAGAGLLLADRFVFHRAGPNLSFDPDGSTTVVAVLPFKATGSDDGGFLAAGLHDDLLTRLARLDAFKVISRTSMMEYADTAKNMREIGEELGADLILEGGVQALGERVRVNAQLIDAMADEHIWADTYDRQLSAADLFDIQSELALVIASQLQVTLSASDRASATGTPTRNTAAYNAYLQGLQSHLSGAFTPENERQVVAAFEEAVELDPDFGLAWARLSIARSRLAQITHDEDLGDAALLAFARARALAPELVETELAWAVYLYRVMREYQQAVISLEAVNERTQNVEALTIEAWLLRRLGQYDQAYATLLRAEELDPRNPNIVDSLVNTAIQLDDCAAAGRHATSALKLSPQLSDTRTQVAYYELQCTGDAEHAMELLSDIEFESGWHRYMAWLAAFTARDFERQLAIAESPDPQPEPLEPVAVQLQHAEALRWLGRLDESAVALEAAGDLFTAADRNGTDVESAEYANKRQWYHSMRGDTAATRRWIAEHKRRLWEQTKGDRMQTAYARIDYAMSLAAVGLFEEAIEELREMLEQPGGWRFTFVDAIPYFDALRDYPGYIELRERFGDSQKISQIPPAGNPEDPAASD